ncbi:MAG: hypothetical protein ACOC0A_02685, partial [Planctomycetota bacterium]
MSKDKNIEIQSEWVCDVPDDVVGVATTMRDHMTFVVGANDGGCLIDGRGNIVKELFDSTPIERVRSSGDGRYFAVLTQNGDLIGFSAGGEVEWEIDVEGASDFDLGWTAETVALAVPPYSVIVAETEDPDVNVDLTFQHTVASLAMLETDRSAVIAAGHLGELSRVNMDWELAWKLNVGLENGPVQLSHAAENVAIPVSDEGVQAYSLSGEQVASFEVGGNAMAVASAPGPSGPLYCVLIEGPQLLIVDGGGEIVWERVFERLVVDYDWSADGSMLVAGVSNQKVYGFRMAAAELPDTLRNREEADGAAGPGETPAARREEKEDVSAGGEKEGMPRPRGALVVGETCLEDDTIPTMLGDIVVTPDGSCGAAITSEGVIVVDDEGDVVETADLTPAPRLISKRNNDTVFAWNEEKLISFDLRDGGQQIVSFGDDRARLLDCTNDGQRVGFVTEGDEMVLLKSGAGEICRRPVTPPPTQLHLSPAGSTVLTRDGEGRFRFFDEHGKQQRKQRISDNDVYDQVILEEGFCALGGRKGRVIVHAMGGKV